MLYIMEMPIVSYGGLAVTELSSIVLSDCLAEIQVSLVRTATRLAWTQMKG